MLITRKKRKIDIIRLRNLLRLMENVDYQQYVDRLMEYLSADNRLNRLTQSKFNRTILFLQQMCDRLAYLHAPVPVDHYPDVVTLDSNASNRSSDSGVVSSEYTPESLSSTANAEDKIPYLQSPEPLSSTVNAENGISYLQPPEHPPKSPFSIANAEDRTPHLRSIEKCLRFIIGNLPTPYELNPEVNVVNGIRN